MKSLAVSIPLSLTQCLTQTVHNHHLSGITPTEMLVNAALAYSIYGNDRLTKDSLFREKVMVNIATAGAMSAFVSDVYTLPLAAMVPFLVYDYKTIKKQVSTIKPFFVSFFWVLCTYLQPLLVRHDLDISKDFPFVVSLFFLFSSFSHIADIKDIHEDYENDIYTPAVMLGEKDSRTFAYTLTTIGLFAHSFSKYSMFDFGYDFVTIGVVLAYLESLQVTIATLAGILFYHSTKLDQILSYDFMTAIMKSSDIFHNLAVESLPWIMEHTEKFPDQVRKKIILEWMEVMKTGDFMGSMIMEKYMQVVKDSFEFLN